MEHLTGLTGYQPKSVDGKFLVPEILSVFQSFQYKFETMFDQLRTELLSVSKEQREKIEHLEAENIVLHKKIEKLEDKIDCNDAYERRDTVILSGKAVPPVGRDEDCSLLTCKLIKDKLNYVISPNDISVVHRLGDKKISQGPDRRNIIVKFCRRNSKVDIVAAARRMKAENFFINESLTPVRQTIAYVLRKAKSQFPAIISGSTTLDGKNYVWLKPPNSSAPDARPVRHAVYTYDRLVQFCTKSLGKPLSHFLDTWTH